VQLHFFVGLAGPEEFQERFRNVLSGGKPLEILSEDLDVAGDTWSVHRQGDIPYAHRRGDARDGLLR
jgi:hypothetical protein